MDDSLSFRQSESRPPVDWRDDSASLYNPLRSAVRRELVSEVPVSLLLSGGWIQVPTFLQLFPAFFLRRLLHRFLGKVFLITFFGVVFFTAFFTGFFMIDFFAATFDL